MPEREPFIFSRGWVHSRDVIYVHGAPRSMHEADVFESVVLRWDRGTWGLWQIGTKLRNVVTAEPGGIRTVFCVGIDGYVEISDANGRRAEPIDNSDDGPDKLRQITFAHLIGNRIFAVGMQRMIYARDIARGPWRRIDDGVRVPRQSLEIDGLKAIETDGHGTYVTVGLHGGIWIRERDHWRSVVSPTNIKLESIRWLNGVLHIGGGGGLLLRGSPEALDVVDQTSTHDTLWSLETYRGALYLATSRHSIWKLVGDDLEQVELPGGPDVTTRWLHANDDVLLSVGERDVLVYDGNQWTRLEPPPPEVAWPFEW